MNLLRRVLRHAFLWLIAIAAVPAVVFAIDYTVDLGGFSGAQTEGLRGTFFAKKATICREIFISNLNTNISPNTSAQYDGTVKSIHLRLHNAVTYNPEIVFYNGFLNDAVSMGTITVTGAGSATGDLSFLTPSASNTVKKNTQLTAYVKVGSGTAVEATASICIQPDTTYIVR